MPLLHIHVTKVVTVCRSDGGTVCLYKDRHDFYDSSKVTRRARVMSARNYALLGLDASVHVSKHYLTATHRKICGKKARAPPACDVPHQQQSRRFVTEPALTNSTPIKGRLIILDGRSCLGRATRWFKQSLTRPFK
jgi:hypothetical protein